MDQADKLSADSGSVGSNTPSESSTGQPLWLPEADFGAADYVRLPGYGVDHYNLTDAALVGALDMWSVGAVEGVPCESWLDEHENPAVRKALEPLRAQLLAALVRSVESRQLAAEVRGRALATSQLIPEQTYVALDDLVDWLEVHGHERGEFIADIQEAHQDDPWYIASQVAEDRAKLRFPETVDEAQAGAFETLGDNAAEIASLKQELRIARLRISHLEFLKLGGRHSNTENKPPSTRQRRTLLTVIAALCKSAGISPSSRGAAAAIASATEELGVPVSDDSIRMLLRDIPDAIGSRSR